MQKIAAVLVTAKKENLSCNRYAKRGEKMLYDSGAISKCLNGKMLKIMF